MKEELITLLKIYKTELALSDSIAEYVDKICERANIISFYDKNIIAFIAFYCNDIRKEKAFITMILVDSTCQKKGLGQMLLDAAILQLKYNNFKSLSLEVLQQNKNAIKFYKRNKFKEVSKRGNYLIMKKSLTN